MSEVPGLGTSVTQGYRLREGRDEWSTWTGDFYQTGIQVRSGEG